MKHETQSMFSRTIDTPLFGWVDTTFTYHPEEKGNVYEPHVPAELDVLNVFINEVDVVDVLDEDEYSHIQDCIFKLLEEENESIY